MIEYRNHAVLNLGQALQGMRYVYSYPDVDSQATRGTPWHFLLSLGLRSERVANDLFFPSFPPHWHHTEADVQALHKASPKRWFQYGYSAWRFSASGEFKNLTGREDKRWDPRCKPNVGAPGGR